MNNKIMYITEELQHLFPDADCELDFSNILELTIAVMLSAQTTDIAVNKVTPALFARYHTTQEYADADVTEIETLIKQIGLYRNKAKNVKLMAKRVLTDYEGVIPHTIDELVTLPGIGRKTANVVLSVGFGLPGFAVDTHVERIAKRLALVSPKATVDKIEKELKTMFPENKWNKLHHQLIFFGRYKCKARNPDCVDCPFQDMCTYYNK